MFCVPGRMNFTATITPAYSDPGGTGDKEEIQ